MPYKANEARRHRIPRARYRVSNWPEYDRALQQRGSLTVWMTPEALAAWHPPKTGRRGRSCTYSDIAIETGHLLRLAFGRPWRQTEGLLRSGATRLGGRVPVNPSGGLVSRGHPVGATGTAQLVELVTQLRGRAGDRQVQGARVGLAENAGGYTHPEAAACVVTILSRD